ncbi:H(+)/Cl(-) exchange transporter ClcA [Paenochrobactrum pullorum]|uniref:H(+)/Cl(-) exchange transporter ClcA n=1 Tax=Paenochrobactrum pullorum TaxID=1324351 RepID=UPI0035BC1082
MDDRTLQIDKPGNHRAQARYIFLAALTGIFTGIAGSYFHLIINEMMRWPQKLSEYFNGISLIVISSLIVMICTVLSAYIVRRFAPEASGSGVQEIEGAIEGLRDVRWKRILPVKFLVGISAISSGLVLGREGPTIHIGASFGAAITSFFKVSDAERRGILAAGAAAGLACAFNAPLAGILFIIEETRKQFPYTFRTYMGVIASALLATIFTQIIGGTAPDMSMPDVKVELLYLPAFVVLGCLFGFVGVALNAGIMWAVNFASRIQKIVPYLYPALIGLSVGALFIILPQSVTGGENVILQLTHQKIGLALLLLLAVTRYFTTVGSYSSGVPGGIFAPMLTLATCIGLSFSGILDILFPETTIAAVAFVIAAMGALFTASVRAPVVGIVLTLELTGAYDMAVPLIIACLMANLTAEWIGGKPIYEQLLDRTLLQAGIKPKKQPHESHSGIA